MVLDTLYHYTDLKGFQSIIEGKSIWASDIRYLNDYEEVKAGKRSLETIIDMFDEEIGRFPHSNEVLDHLKCLQEEEITSFAVCFCRKPDLLSQWRGYGAGGTGISLGFSSQALQNIDGFTLAEISYEKDAFVTNVEKSIKKAKAKLSSPSVVDEEGRIIRDLVNEIKILCFVNKNGSFHEEAETRLFSISGFENEIPVLYRVSGQRLVPYLSVDLSSHWREILRCVYLGPANDQKELLKSVNEFLHYNNLSDVEIFNSKVPYRV
ncbi:DUF2971 domain-containing protein [Thalassospira alkalitolerans]|uniref:DUF2971 domain-containing protein n=1 Tax=Thalassospira alkalitolerans TaxID=1293890 RepID=UPI003AA93A75